MIITLVGADFSGTGKNIGTLTTWTISRILGDGATYSGDTIVNRGASMSGTVTIAEGYSVGSDGVSVTMGGNTVSAATVSADGKTVTISISAVTGTVVIRVPTVNNSTGTEDDGTESGANLFTKILDSSNGNDWYVMYSKVDTEAGTTPIRYGINTSNSQKAKNVVIEGLEDGATYSIYFKNNTANTSRCRIVTFAEAWDDIDKSALSTDVTTASVTTTNVIKYDYDNNTYEYDTTFVNTLNHKTLVMTLGWAASAGGSVDLDVKVYKVS